MGAQLTHERVPSDKWHKHEALHTAYLAMMLVDGELLDHPAIIENEEWQKLARSAHTALFKLHQRIEENPYASTKSKDNTGNDGGRRGSYLTTNTNASKYKPLSAEVALGKRKGA